MAVSMVRYLYIIDRCFRIIASVDRLVLSLSVVFFHVSPAAEFPSRRVGIAVVSMEILPCSKTGLLGAVARQRRLNRWGLVTVRLSSWKGQRMSDVHQGHRKLQLLQKTEDKS